MKKMKLRFRFILFVSMLMLMSLSLLCLFSYSAAKEEMIMAKTEMYTKMGKDIEGVIMQQNKKVEKGEITLLEAQKQVTYYINSSVMQGLGSRDELLTKDIRKHLRSQFLQILATLFVVSVIIVICVSNYINESFVKLENSTKEIANRNLSVGIQSNQSIKIEELANSHTTMAVPVSPN